jgi:hypothetical protein
MAGHDASVIRLATLSMRVFLVWRNLSGFGTLVKKIPERFLQIESGLWETPKRGEFSEVRKESSRRTSTVSAQAVMKCFGMIS